MQQNAFLTTDWLSMEALDLLTNSLEITSHFYTGFNKEFQKPFAVGETVRVEYPPKWLIRNGIPYDPQGIQEIQTTITCNQVFGVDFEWNDVEQVLQLRRTTPVRPTSTSRDRSRRSRRSGTSARAPSPASSAR